MTHWDIARFFIEGAFLGLCAFGGYTLGGIIG